MFELCAAVVTKMKNGRSVAHWVKMNYEKPFSPEDLVAFIPGTTGVEVGGTGFVLRAQMAVMRSYNGAVFLCFGRLPPQGSSDSWDVCRSLASEDVMPTREFPLCFFNLKGRRDGVAGHRTGCKYDKECWNLHVDYNVLKTQFKETAGLRQQLEWLERPVWLPEFRSATKEELAEDKASGSTA